MSAARALPPSPLATLTETQRQLYDAVPANGWVLSAQLLRDLKLTPSRGYSALACLVAGDRPLLRAEKYLGETYVRRTG